MLRQAFVSALKCTDFVGADCFVSNESIIEIQTIFRINFRFLIAIQLYTLQTTLTNFDQLNFKVL